MVQEENQKLRSMTLSAFSFVKNLAKIPAIQNAGIAKDVDFDKTTTMATAIFDHYDKKRSASKVEIEKMVFPVKFYVRLIYTGVLCTGVAFLLLLMFAMRVASLMLR
jgi:hypothetical protein